MQRSLSLAIALLVVLGGHHRQALLALLVFTTLVSVTRADATARLRASWKEKNARVVVFSPDGKSLVSSGAEGYRLRDAGTGQVRAVLSAPSPILLSKPVFTPDSRLLFAQVISDRSLPLVVHDVKAWDVATGRLRGSFPDVGEHLDEGSFELSEDGRWLAFVDNSERLPAQVKTSKILVERGRHFDISINMNPGLPRVKIWDVPAWKEIAVVNGARPLAFSPDGKLLATGGRDWKDPVAKLWDTEAGRLRSELKDRTAGLWPLAFSPDGRFLASCEHGVKSLWELTDGRRWAIETKGTGLSSRGPVFSPDGKRLFPNGLPWMNPGIGQREEYYCFDLTTLPPSRLDLGPAEVIISPDGRRYAAVLGERGTGGSRAVVLHELPSLRESDRFDVTGLSGAAFSPDGRWLALLVGRNEVIPPGSATRSIMEIQLLDPATARVLVTIPSPGPTWGNYGWKFSPDGNTLAVYYRTGSNIYGPGDPDPSERPLNVEIWEIPRQ